MSCETLVILLVDGIISTSDMIKVGVSKKNLHTRVYKRLRELGIIFSEWSQFNALPSSPLDYILPSLFISG